MAHMTDKESHPLPSSHAAFVGIYANGIGGTARRVIIMTALAGTLLAGVTLTQRFLAKVHLRSIGGKMRAKLDALLQHLPHLGPHEFEAYINKTAKGLLLRQIENHLRICHVCKEEVEIVQQAIRDFKSDGLHSGLGYEEPRAAKNFQWGDNSTLWIDDEKYRLRPVGDTHTKALVEGLSFSALEKMAEEDARVPGTHLVSIESHGLEIIAPLSKFAVKKTTSAAGSALQPFNPMLDSLPTEVALPASTQVGEHYIIEIFTDGQGTIFLHASASDA